MAEYLFHEHADDPEYQRLCLIQKAFDEKTQKHLLKAGLNKGMHCLEVGAGAGSIAEWMQEIVGQEGHVVAVDLSTRFIDQDRAGYTFLEGDILRVNITSLFDLIHVRYVLIHNKNSTAILNRLFTLLKPGGKIVVEEPDFTLGKWIDAPQIDTLKRVNSAIIKMFDNKGLKARFGSTAHIAMKEAGFKIEDEHSYLHLNSGGDEMAEVMALSAQALGEYYVKTDICDEEDVRAYIEACGNKETLAVYYATVVVTAGKAEQNVMEEDNSQLRKEGVFEAKAAFEIEACFEVMKQLRLEIEPIGFLEQIQRQREEGYRLFYLTDAQRIVAAAGCHIGHNLAWGRYLYIDDLVTREEARSSSYGRELLKYLKNFAKEEGCGQVHLDSGVQRFGAHKFYLREGFNIASHHFSYKVEM